MKRGGFTLSEMLITLVILGFVGALGVPMLGQQKLKKPNIQYLKHGVFECYYDDTGTLRQFMATEDDPAGELTTPAGNSCHFDPPSANFFAITAIGTGGRGGMYGGPAYPTYTIGITPKIKEISTGPNFQSDLSALPESADWIRSNWDAANVRPIYTVSPYVGEGGNSSPSKGVKSQDLFPQCENNLCSVISSVCPEECIEAVAIPGGNSGTGHYWRVRHHLVNTDNVSYSGIGVRNETTSGPTTLSFNPSQYLTVYDVPGGTNGNGSTQQAGHNGSTPNPEKLCVGLTCTQGGSIVNYGAETITGHPAYDGIAGDDADAAEIVATPAYITCSYNLSILKDATYGSSGEPAKVMTRIYEKLPSNGVDLYPSSSPDLNSRVVINSANIGERDAIRVNGGEAGSILEIQDEVEDIINQLFFPETFKNDVSSKEPVIQLFVNPKLESKVNTMVQAGIVPGASGSGAYPFIRSLSLNLNRKIGAYSVSSGNETKSVEEGTTCWNGAEPVASPDGQEYCAATEGRKGAIVIAW